MTLTELKREILDYVGKDKRNALRLKAFVLDQGILMDPSRSAYRIEAGDSFSTTRGLYVKNGSRKNVYLWDGER